MMIHPVSDELYDAAAAHSAEVHSPASNQSAVYCGLLECRGWLHLSLTMFILGLEIVWTVTGNLLVVIAILHEKHLRVPANYLIFNLASADLLVGSLVMPISAVREVSTHWVLGKVICEIHCHLDVMCCTSSILTLLAIAWDRSMAVRNINYFQKRTPKRMLATIAIVWFVALCITIPQAITKYLLEQRDESQISEKDSESEECIVPQDWYYQLYATSCSFYVPLVLIITLYIRIYQTARSTIRKDKFRSAKVSNVSNNAGAENLLLLSNLNEIKQPPDRTPRGGDRKLSVAQEQFEMNLGCVKSNPAAGNDIAPEQDSSRVSSDGATEVQPSVTNAPRLSLRFSNEIRKNGKRLSEMSAFRRTHKCSHNRHSRVEQKREKKAARVLLIVTGTFITCWTPFFLTALIMAFCAEACWFEYQPLLLSIVLWLGYTCSAFNPIIYTIFSPDFRHAFQKILHLQRRV